ncbi:endonuclease/exonuclease/phosphatase family protein [Labilibacter sediminis]|nr:endonuclease/exonuclease/phosphatase family protein [Labilibacter sediminis]
MTYNIKNDYQKDGPDIWDNRKNDMVDLLTSSSPNIIGIQEALLNQIAYIDSVLVNYKTIGVGRDDGENAGEFCTIFYDATQFKVLQQNTFWLSENPDSVSIGWEAAYPRICTYGLFEHLQSHEKIWVLNTHFDHQGAKAREESARLILKFINETNTDKLPLILMGDFNAEENETSIQILSQNLDDAKYISQNICDGPVGTFNGFKNEPIQRRIDYFFVKKLTVKSYAHIDKRRENDRHISDHQPVVITINF